MFYWYSPCCSLQEATTEPEAAAVALSAVTKPSDSDAKAEGSTTEVAWSPRTLLGMLLGVLGMAKHPMGNHGRHFCNYTMPLRPLHR